MKRAAAPYGGEQPRNCFRDFEDGQKVFLEVFYIFKTYGKAQKRIRNSLFFCFFRRQVRVSLGAGIGHEAFGTAQTFSKLDEGNPFKDFSWPAPVYQHKTKSCRQTRWPVFLDLIPRMFGKAWIEDLLHIGLGL